MKYIALTSTNNIRVALATAHIVSVTENGSGAIVHTTHAPLQVRESYHDVMSAWEKTDEQSDGTDDQTAPRKPAGVGRR